MHMRMVGLAPSTAATRPNSSEPAMAMNWMARMRANRKVEAREALSWNSWWVM
jgi:hypothetical protein